MILITLMVLCVRLSTSSFDCTNTIPEYQFTSHPNSCPSINPDGSKPHIFPPIGILSGGNMSEANFSSNSDFICDGDESSSNCEWVRLISYAEFDQIGETYILVSFSDGHHYIIDVLTWYVSMFEEDFRAEHLEVIKKNSTFAYVILCDNSSCLYYHLNEFGNVTFLVEKRIERTIYDVTHIVDAESEDVYLLFMLNSTILNEEDVLIQKLDLYPTPATIDEFEIPTVVWELPYSESQYRFSMHHQYLGFEVSKMSFFVESVSTEYQDLAFIYNDSLVYFLKFNFTNLTRSSSFEYSLFYQTNSTYIINSVRGISTPILRLDYENSNCSEYTFRDEFELLQVLVIKSRNTTSGRSLSILEVISFPEFENSSSNFLNPSGLDEGEMCPNLQFWNGTGCELRTVATHEVEDAEFTDLTEVRYMEHLFSQNDSLSKQLSFEAICEFYITSQRIYSERDQALFFECLGFLNSTEDEEETCEVDHFKTYSEIRRWMLYNSWYNQIYLVTTDDKLMSFYYGMKVDTEDSYFEYPYDYQFHLLTETKLKGVVKDISLSKNGYHVFIAHERKKWEIDSIERRFEICLFLINRTNARMIQDNLQNNQMIDLVDEIRDVCIDYPPNTISVSDFNLYFSSLRDGFYTPYFDRAYIELPDPGYFSDFPLQKSTCINGFYCIDGKANICPSGYFCESLSNQPEICTYSESKFKTCYFGGNTNSFGLPCPIGNICPSQIFPPIPCPPGFQQNYTVFELYLEYYEEVTGDINITLSNDTYNVTNSVNVTVNATVDEGPPTNEFYPCDIGEWCPLYIFFDNLCPAGTECSETSQLLPALCNYTFPSEENDYYGSSQYCPNGTYDAELCPTGSRCEGPLEIEICDLHFHCPEGTMFQMICPGGYYCPSPSEKILCPWHHFCTSGSISPNRCSLLSICPPGQEYDRLNFVGILGIGGVALLVYLLLKCLKKVSRRFRKIKRKKEAKSNWKELGKMDVNAIAAAFGIKDLSMDVSGAAGESFENGNPLQNLLNQQQNEEVSRSRSEGEEFEILDVEESKGVVDVEEEEKQEKQEEEEEEEGGGRLVSVIRETGEEQFNYSRRQRAEEQVQLGRGGGEEEDVLDEGDFPSSAFDQLRREREEMNHRRGGGEEGNNNNNSNSTTNNNNSDNSNSSSFHNTSQTESGRKKIVRLGRNRLELRDVYCFPCDLFTHILCCRYCGGKKKKKSDFRVDLGFDNLSLTVKSNGKVVLNGVTGEIMHGGVCAVMGLSGCGKSSFITTLAQRAHYGFTGGKIYINRVEENLGRLKKFVGFVPQEDVMMRTMTVEENISFSARTRLDTSVGGREIRRKVDKVIDLLGLSEIRSSPIGDENVRGISGGQRKRVNIALELVADPLVLFLDEPTSGLDSSSSQQVCDALKRIAKEGINVITVIHQPRFEIFEQFDNLLLLGVGGEIVYFGSVPEMMPYFESLGFHLTRKGVNPIDFAMDCVDGKVRDQEGKEWEQKDFFEEWKKRRKYSSLENMKPRAPEERKIREKITKEIDARRTPTTRQFFESFKRALVLKLRAWKTFITDNILVLIGGMFLGILFMGEEYIGSLPTSLSDQCPDFIRIKCEVPVYDPLLKHSALIGLIMALGGVMSSLNTFGVNRAVFLREQTSGLSTLAEFLSRSTVDVINIIVSPWIFLGVYYTIKAPRGLLMLYVLILTGLHYASYGFGYLISVTFSPDVNKIAGVVILLITFLFAGLNISVAGMAAWPIPMSFIPYLCYLRFSTEALYLIEITRLKDFHNVEFGMELYGYSFDHLWWCILALFLTGLAYRILAYFFWIQSVPTSRYNKIKSRFLLYKFRLRKLFKKYAKLNNCCMLFCCLTCFCCFCATVLVSYGRGRKKKRKKKNRIQPRRSMMMRKKKKKKKRKNPFLTAVDRLRWRNRDDDDDDDDDSYTDDEDDELSSTSTSSSISTAEERIGNNEDDDDGNDRLRNQLFSPAKTTVVQNYDENETDDDDVEINQRRCGSDEDEDEDEEEEVIVVDCGEKGTVEGDI